MVLHTSLARSKLWTVPCTYFHVNPNLWMSLLCFQLSTEILNDPFYIRFQARSIPVHNPICLGQFGLVTKFVNYPNIYTGFPRICESPFSRFKWAPTLANGRLYNCNPSRNCEWAVKYFNPFEILWIAPYTQFSRRFTIYERVFTSHCNNCEWRFTQFQRVLALTNDLMFNCNPFQNLWVSSLHPQLIRNFMNCPLYTTVFAAIQHLWAIFTGHSKVFEWSPTQRVPTLTNGMLYTCNPFKNLWVSPYIFSTCSKFCESPLIHNSFHVVTS